MSTFSIPTSAKGWDSVSFGTLLTALLAGGAAIVALDGAPMVARVPLGLLAVLYLPGGAVTAALFPAAADLPRSGRLALGISLSLIVNVLLALGLNYSPDGLTAQSIIWATCGVTLMACAAAAVRRAQSAAGLSFEAPHWFGERRMAITVTLLVLILVASSVLALTLARPTQMMTEFYVLGANGTSDSYPQSLVAGQPTRLTVGIHNRENVPETYTIQVISGGQQLATVSAGVANGEERRIQLPFTAPIGGANQQIQLVLFRAGATTAYRTLDLWLDVRSQ